MEVEALPQVLTVQALMAVEEEKVETEEPKEIIMAKLAKKEEELQGL